MTFSQTKADAGLVKALSGMVDSGRISHAILLHEDDGGGGVGVALAFLQYLYCRNRHDGDSCAACPPCNKIGKLIHPDIYFIFPVVLAGSSNSEGSPSEPYLVKWRELLLQNPGFTEAELYDALGFEGKATTIGASEANDLIRKLSRTSLEGGYTSVIIYLPERMNPTAANRLLKVLEEPPAMVQFVLVTHAPEKLLPTISSRCQLFRLQGDGATQALRYDDSGLFAELMDELLARDFASALETGERLAALPSRDNAILFCKFASEKMRRMFLLQQKLSALVPDADEVEKAWASKCRKTFPRKALEALDRSAQLIRRNVNMKILFTDLVNKLFLSI